MAEIEAYRLNMVGDAVRDLLDPQRIVNGDGRLEREYALGRGRTDLLIVWPQGGRERRFVVECKVLRTGLERTIARR